MTSAGVKFFSFTSASWIHTCVNDNGEGGKEHAALALLNFWVVPDKSRTFLFHCSQLQTWNNKQTTLSGRQPSFVVPNWRPNHHSAISMQYSILLTIHPWKSPHFTWLFPSPSLFLALSKPFLPLPPFSFISSSLCQRQVFLRDLFFVSFFSLPILSSLEVVLLLCEQPSAPSPAISSLLSGYPTTFPVQNWTYRLHPSTFSCSISVNGSFIFSIVQAIEEIIFKFYFTVHSYIWPIAYFYSFSIWDENQVSYCIILILKTTRA